MKYNLRLIIVLALGLVVFAGSCSASTVTTISGSAVGITGVNDSLPGYYDGTAIQSRFISASDSDSISSERHWQVPISLGLSGLSTWANPFLESGFLQLPHYGADVLAFAETQSSQMSAVDGNTAALFDGGHDSSSWTAADQTITSQALNSRPEYGSLPAAPVIGSSEVESMNLVALCRHHQPPPTVPEPSTLPMVGGGLLMSAGLLRHRLRGLNR